MADDLRAAVQEFMSAHGVVTRFLLLVETMDTDDGFAFHTVPDLLTPWDVRGFLRHALEESYTVEPDEDENSEE